MHILVLGERTQQALVAGQVRHDAQLDLRVVGRQQHVPVGRDERLADLAAFRRPDRDVLQVGVRRREPAGRGDGLVVRRMHAARERRDLQRQLVRVGALQLADAAVVDDDTRQFVVFRKLDEHVFRGRWLPLRCLANDRQPQLVEQDLLELLGRAEVERAAREFMGRLFELRHPVREFAALAGKHVAIDQHTGFFHVEEDRNQRLLDVDIDVPQ